ncbi:antibiotic biosynthesis monooxygenase [Bacillus sp. ISL-47]|uniref:putative quinol monooxygenase n=1 Tax=Bacillus sp. ISL-47 TaxID=2819130 RepID=UPI001BE85B34|nr:putative quinol monooxygenase [Bacillus sp. ISL-47]MBT2689654.1 antibiotic biosynthesis monooxygenase [Bacillus sp. ISL-47]MBT2709299.1 antibiotic biosynthesis monooxygenase [Pseudomonas sp. ISL-84]
MIIIHADFQIQPEQENDFLAEIRPLIEASRAEEGNISYDLLKDAEKAGSYTMVELWKDMNAVKFHNQTEHFTGFTGKAQQFMAAPPQVKLYNADAVK